MPDDLSSVETDTPAHPSEQEFDNTLSRAFDAWNGAGQAEHVEPEPEQELEAKPEKPSRKPSRAAKELSERPDFSESDDEVDEPAESKSRRADKKEGEDVDEDRKPKAKDAQQADPKDKLNKDISDEFDKIESPRARDWKAVRAKLKEVRAETRQRDAELEAIRAEYDAFKAAQENPQPVPDDVKAELEQARAEAAALREYKQRVDIVGSEDFQRRFQEPANRALAAILTNVVAKYGNGGEQWQEWANQIWTAELKGELPADYWSHKIVEELSSNPDLQRETVNGIAKYQQLQQAKNHAAEQLSRSPELAQQWFQQSRQEYFQRYEQGLKSVARELEEELGEWAKLPADAEALKKIKDPAERQKAQKHAETFNKEIWPKFSKVLDDLNSEDAVTRGAAHARIAAKALEAERIKQEIKSLRAENKMLQAENKRYHAVRGVPARAGGATNKRDSKPPVDIFSDDRAAMKAAWGDDDD